MRLLRLALIVFCLLFVAARAFAENPATAPSYHAGQRWAYHTRPGEEKSSVIVLKIEKDEKLGDIIHVAIHDIQIKNPVTGGVNREIPHAPIARKSLGASVTTLMADSVPLPAFEEGYQQWKAAKGGVFTVSLAEVVTFVDKALNR